MHWDLLIEYDYNLYSDVSLQYNQVYSFLFTVTSSVYLFRGYKLTFQWGHYFVYHEKNNGIRPTGSINQCLPGPVGLGFTWMLEVSL